MNLTVILPWLVFVECESDQNEDPLTDVSSNRFDGLIIEENMLHC